MTTWAEENRYNWDSLVPIHRCSDFYDVAGFVAGGCTLRDLELELVGDVSGLHLLHLQCHFGLDTLSWARRGAEATGVDFSRAAVEEARRLAAHTGLIASFVEADVQRLPQFDSPFDLAITTYGVLCWLSDLPAWAAGIERNLCRGGRLVVVDFHPLLEAIYPGKMTGAAGYFGGAEPSTVRTTGTYADQSADLAYDEHRWQHTLGDVVSALAGSGLVVERLTEYPFVSYGLFDDTALRDDGRWWRADWPSWIPYMFSIVARRAQ